MAMLMPGRGCSPGTKSTGTLVLDLTASKTVRSKCLCLNHPVLVFCYSSSSRLRQLSIPEVSVPDQMCYISSHPWCLPLFPTNRLSGEWSTIIQIFGVSFLIIKGTFVLTFFFPEFLRIFVKISLEGKREGLVMRCLREGE